MYILCFRPGPILHMCLVLLISTWPFPKHSLLHIPWSLRNYERINGKKMRILSGISDPIFDLHFGRNDDLINSFWILLTFNKCIYCFSDQGLICLSDFNLTISKALNSTYSLIVEKRKDKWKEDENSLRNFRPKNGWGLCNLNITEAWHRPAQLGEIPFVFLFLRLLKFRYCEKATRFEKIFNLFFEIT